MKAVLLGLMFMLCFSGANVAYAANYPQIQIAQSVMSDTNNSSTNNLVSGNSYTFTGLSNSTLNVSGLQVSLATDQNCTLKVQQSPDGANWDISDSYTYYANANFGITVQAISLYYRVIVTNITTNSTTYFRLQSALCPIVEALPRSLDNNGNLKVAVQSGQDVYGFAAENTPLGEIRTVEPTRLIGAAWDGGVIDTNFWLWATNGFGTSISQSNTTIILNCGNIGTNRVSIYSARRAKYLSASTQRYRSAIKISANTNMITRWGAGYGSSMPTITDGAWFQGSNGTLSVVTSVAGIQTKIDSGSFNGTRGATYSISTNSQTYEIYWTTRKAYFMVSDQVLHTVTASQNPWSGTLTLHGFLDITNVAATSSIDLVAWSTSIYRLGKLETAPIWKHMTNVSTNVLKLSGGRLNTILINSWTSGAFVSIYDSTGTAINTIALVTLTNGGANPNLVPQLLTYLLDFYNGLTIITGGTIDATVTYE